MATKKFLSNINLNQNELQNVLAHKLASAPNNPVIGQEYFNTADSQKYIYTSGGWISETAQGTTYTFSTGLTNTSGTITLNQATTQALGGVIVGTNISVNSGTITVADASTSSKGVIEIATDSEASTGTSEVLAINPKQLASAISGKITLSSLSIDSGSTNYLGYDNTNGKFSAKVDTTVTASSTNLITSGAVNTAINNAIAGGVIYKGVWTVTGETDYSAIPFPVKAGWEYEVSGSAQITLDGVTVDWNTGDYIRFKNDVASEVALTNSDFNKIDNTESSDVVKLNATQTLTNKTIDADDNTISDLTTSNLKSGVLQTTVRATSSASDTAIPSEKAVASAISGMTKKLSANNGALTASGGQCTWTISNSLSTADVVIRVYEISSGDEIETENSASSSTITIKINSSSNISADTYKAVIVG